MTQGNLPSQPAENQTMKTPERDYDQARQILNTSEFLHSRMGLLDNQVTINYDLGMPSLDEEGKARSAKKPK